MLQQIPDLLLELVRYRFQDLGAHVAGKLLHHIGRDVIRHGAEDGGDLFGGKAHEQVVAIVRLKVGDRRTEFVGAQSADEQLANIGIDARQHIRELGRVQLSGA